MIKFFLSTTGNGVVRAEPTAGGHWSVRHLLDGKEVTCLAADSNQAGVVYAGTRHSGVLCSTDYARTWHPAGLSGQIIKAISVSRVQPGVIYAGTKPALVFVSNNHGQDWTELSAFRKIFSRRFWFSPAEKPYTAYVQGIALSPSDPNLIVVGIEAGAVVRSVDGGKTWQDHRKGALRDCHTITFHPSCEDWLYEAGGTGSGAAVSQDRGSTWRQLKGLDCHYGWACAAHPAHPEIGYFSAAPSVRKAHSKNNAQAFIYRLNEDGNLQKMEGGLPQPLNSMPYALLTDPSEPEHVFAGLSNGDIWWSQNSGDVWKQLPLNMNSINRTMVMFS